MIKRVLTIFLGITVALSGVSFASGTVTESKTLIDGITLSGERIESDQAEYFTGDVTVNFIATNEDGIKSIRILIGGEEAESAEYMGTNEGIEMPDGDVVNAENTADVTGDASVSDTTKPVTNVIDEMVIKGDFLKDRGSRDFAYKGELEVTDINGNVDKKSFEFYADIIDLSGNQSQDAAAEKQALVEIMDLGDSGVEVIDSSTYMIKVNTSCNVTTVYKKASNSSYEPYKVMTCSTARSGYSTPSGTFKIGPKGDKVAKSRWAALSSGESFGQYLVRFNGGKCFHSVIYKERYSNHRMILSTYNGLGAAKSAGCVRLRVTDAKWIYDNCPNGTVVTVYKDANNPGPLGKPAYSKLSTAKSSYGWDPTDSDTGNPAYGGNGIPTGNLINAAKNDISLKSAVASRTTFGYSGNECKPTISIEGLTKGKDFNVTYPADCKSIGTHTAVIDGINDYYGKINVEYTITDSVEPLDLSSYTITLSKNELEYTGSTSRPTVSVNGLVKGENYDVVYPANSYSLGTHTLSVIGLNDCRGTVNLNYKIVIAKRNITSLYTTGKKKFKVKWSKLNSKMSGCKIMYSTDPNFKRNIRTITVKPRTVNSKTIKTVKKKTYYYVKMRVYMQTKTNTYYSVWSPAKRVKVR